MKGGGASSYPVASKRRWRGFAVAVFGLVILSMLVPLVFLLGLHNGFHSTGDVTEDRRSTPNGFRNYDSEGKVGSQNQSEDEKSSHIDDLVRRLAPTIPKDPVKSSAKEAATDPTRKNPIQGTAKQRTDLPPQKGVLRDSKPQLDKQKKNVNMVPVTEYVEGVAVDETGKSCQLEFGSYCLWREARKEDMKDSMVKKMKDQLFVARAYFPSVAKLPTHDKLSRELRQNIQEFERIFSESSTDADLPPHIEKKLQKMEDTIGKAKSVTLDCNNVDKKLRQILDLTEDEAHFHMKQSAFLYQLAVQTMPKSLHCLSMRLTVEYFKLQSVDMELQSDKYTHPALHHYVIFSNNILASSVVINSTVMHAKESAKQVFHVITDGQNYYAMKLWFFRKSYKDATVQVMKIEDLKSGNLDFANQVHLSVSNEFRVSFRSVDKPQTTQMSTKYMSVFGDAHFLLPELFPSLKKVVVLDDDIVVKQDLSPLWSIDMQGKVNGAVNFCSVRLGQLKSYLGEYDINEGSCTWISGLNVVDLVKWKEKNLTRTYRKLLKVVKSRTKNTPAKVEALLASLLTFQNLIYPLDDSWVLSGLGHDYGVDAEAIKKAAVLHYNGNMKPWLELGIPKYKPYWKRFLLRDDIFMSQCNVNP